MKEIQRLGLKGEQDWWGNGHRTLRSQPTPEDGSNASCCSYYTSMAEPEEEEEKDCPLGVTLSSNWWWRTLGRAEEETADTAPSTKVSEQRPTIKTYRINALEDNMLNVFFSLLSY